MNLKRFIFFSIIILSASVCRAAIVVQDLRCEYLRNPLGIDSSVPRLSWTLTSGRRGEVQTAYQILVSSSKQLLDANTGNLWDSGKVSSDESAQIEYHGKPLGSRRQCFWKVRVWDRDGVAGKWSPAAEWQMGLLQPQDWSASWISPQPPAADVPVIIRRASYGAAGEGSKMEVTSVLTKQIKDGELKLKISNETMGGDPAKNVPKQLRVEYEFNGQSAVKVVNENQMLFLPDAPPVPYLKKTFEANSSVRRATLYVSALGLYEVDINGHRVGDHVLAPDWTDYRKRVRYQTFDVTHLISRGGNAISALLANGWFSGHIGNGGYQFFGSDPAFLAQLEITYADGHVEKIVSDGSWKSHDSPILATDFMLGEIYDARRELKGWSRADLDDSSWRSVVVRNESQRELDSQVMEPVREIIELHPKTITQPQPAHWVFDLGQNMVGVVRLKISAPAGTRLTLRHAEMLNPDGTLYTTNLRGAPSVDEYICRGGGTEEWQPKFTFHGFRYVELSGLDGKPSKSAITGVVISSDNPQSGEFVCSDPRINQLQSNIQWGQRGNYLSVPTDCPQRDERLGWMGDAEVFIRTATYNADVAAFFTKWMVDVDDGQSPEGAYGDVSPNTMGGKGTPAWADAGVICPWTIYETYGDKRMLEQHLPAMAKWVEYMRQHSNQLIRDGDRGSDYGDWLSINANTPKALIGTAFFAYSTHLLAKSYEAVGQHEEAQKYRQLFEDIKAAFNKRFVAADGRIEGDTQCAYAMALKFDLLPENLRPQAAQRLCDDIKAKGNHLSTGFIGVGYLLPVLTQTGHEEIADQLLMQDSFPSWLFSVKHGATTIWERWDGWTPEKGFQDPGMNSFNHYSLGSCGEYLFGGIGGIRPASPGYKSILIEPVITESLTWAKTSYGSIHGKIATAWKRKGDRLELKVTVPVNTSAIVRFPATDISSIKESGKDLEHAKGIKFLRQEHNQMDLEIGAGTYDFVSQISGR
jgi:alpha-L-rhamnosidase